MTTIDAIALALVSIGCLFFIAGTIGVLRFPDVYTRLHALTKSDNLGLGFVIVGLLLKAGSLTLGLKLVLIWLLVLLASTTACHLTARTALHQHLTERERP